MTEEEAIIIEEIYLIENKLEEKILGFRTWILLIK